MTNSNNRLRFKVDFENTPIMDIEKTINGKDDFDDMVGNLRLKIFGK